MAISLSDATGRLEGWKMIAAFVGRDERTAKRWEGARGLPVRRLPGENRSMVFAYTHELSAWRDSLGTEPAADPVREPVADRLADLPRPRPRPWRWLIAFALLAAALLTFAVSSRPFARSTEIGGTTDPDAAEAYRHARLDWSLRTKTSLEAALALFHRAIERDPHYARAYAGLAQTYSLLREYGGMPEPEAYVKSEAAARRALEIAPDLAEAHAALAFSLFWWGWDATAAEREFRTAIELDPTQSTPHHWLANALQVQNRLPEALREIRRAEELDSGCATCLAHEASILFSAGDVTRASSMAHHLASVAPALPPVHELLAALAWKAGDIDAYIAERTIAARLRGDAKMVQRLEGALFAWKAGGRAAFIATNSAIEVAAYRRGEVTPFAAARALALAGDGNGALSLLEVALRGHDPGMMGTAADDAFVSLRHDPRFAAILAGVRAEP